MKKIIKTILIFSPLVLLIFLTNLFIDPANLFNKDSEKLIAQELLLENNVLGVKNIDDRQMITYYIESLTKKHDCIILGASRGMQISTETTGYDSSFNLGVTGAELRDIISIYYKYENQVGTPENIIITIEPWTLSDSIISTRALTDEYEDFCIENNLNYIETQNIKNEIDKVLELFSISYFQQAINPIFSLDFDFSRTVLTTPLDVANEDIRKSDGSYSYSLDFINRDEATFNSNLNDLKTRIPEIFHNYSLNQDFLIQFETFIKDLKDKDTNIVFFMPPLYPEYYDFILESSYSLSLTESYDIYNKIADEYDIEIIGSFYMDELSSENFYDVLHPTYETVYDMFN